MNIAMASGTLGLAALALIAGPVAAADDVGWYGGINIGRSRATIGEARITGSLPGSGLAANSITDDDSDSGHTLFGGYRFHRNFVLEGGYFDLGKTGFAGTTVPAGTLTGNIKHKGLNLDAIGILPVTAKLYAFGRVGLNYAEAKDSFTGTGAFNLLDPNPGKRDTNYKFGLGLQYNFTPSLGMRLEAEHYRANDAIGSKGDIGSLWFVGMVYRFSERRR